MAAGLSAGGEAATPPILAVRGVKKAFRKKVAVSDVSFEVRPGELLGLIGPNGAGKSTTVKIVTSQLLADEGEVLVSGHDIVKEPLAAKRLIGYVPQDIALYPFLTGREVLEFVAEVRGIAPAEAA
ncbi:MAG: ABC transporter ATP-binding protein, partial [Myxococcales bacterium]|nr:ABC transporter ATP-binding protein [Myxococcales bacterium]